MTVKTQFSAVVSGLIFFALGAGSTIGQVWNGGGADDNWTTADNWSFPPTTGPTANKNFDGSTRLNPSNDFTAGTSFGNITFNSGAGEFVLGGNSITLGGNIANNSSNNQTIAMDLILDGNRGVFVGAGGVTINSVISGAFNLSVSNAGILTLAGANKFSGTLTGSATNIVRLANSLAAQNATLVGDGAGFQFEDGIGNFTTGGIGVGSGSLSLTDTAANAVTLTITGDKTSSMARPITGSGGLVIDMDPAGQQTLVSNASTWSGGTTLNGGNLILQQTNALPTGGALTINGGVMLLNRPAANHNESVGSFNGNGGEIRAANLVTGIVNFTVNTSTTDSWAGVMENGTAATFNFIKNGTGSLTLSGNNAYNGTTSVNAGTLLIDGNQSSSTGNLTVASGATLGGSGTIGGNVTVNGTLSPGSSPGVLALNQNLSFNPGSASLFEIDGIARGTQYDGVNIGGSLTYGGGMTIDFGTTFGLGNYTFNLFDGFTSQSANLASITLAGAYSGAMNHTGSGIWNFTDLDGNAFEFRTTTGNLTLDAIPEPGTASLVMIGLGFWLLRRKRQ